MGIQIKSTGRTEAQAFEDLWRATGERIRLSGSGYWQISRDVCTTIRRFSQSEGLKGRFFQSPQLTVDQAFSRVWGAMHGLRELYHHFWIRLAADQDGDIFHGMHEQLKETSDGKWGSLSLPEKISRRYRQGYEFFRQYAEDAPDFGDDESGGLVIAGLGGELGRRIFGWIDSKKELSSVAKLNDGNVCNTGIDDLIGGLIALLVAERLMECLLSPEEMREKFQKAIEMLEEELMHFGCSKKQMAEIIFRLENRYCENLIDPESFFQGTYTHPAKKFEISSQIISGIGFARMVDQQMVSPDLTPVMSSPGVELLAHTYGLTMSNLYGPMAATVQGLLMEELPSELKVIADNDTVHPYRKAMLLNLITRFSSASACITAQDYWTYRRRKGCSMLRSKTRFMPVS